MHREKIGITAGKIWHFLEKHGEASLTKLKKEIEAPSADVVLQAIGWLAKEDKIVFNQTQKGTIVRLK